MTNKQFKDLYKTLSALPIIRTDNVGKIIYTTIEYQGQTYLLYDIRTAKFIHIGYHIDKTKVPKNYYSLYCQEFGNGNVFMYHNLQGPANYELNDVVSLDFFIHGEFIADKVFPKHPLVVLEKRKTRLKKKIESL